MSRRRNIITCGNCRTMYEVKGRDPRCPACNTRYEDVEPLPPLPPKSMMGVQLERPEFERDPKAPEPAAPLSEFVAAGALLISFVIIVIGVFAASPPIFLGGLALLGATAVVVSIWKLKQMVQRGRDQPDLTGNMSQLFGNFWRRW